MTADRELRIGPLVLESARLFRCLMDREMLDLGLSRAQWLVLTQLPHRAGLSMSEFAEKMELDRAAAGRMVDRLEQKGWVERRPDRHDGRVTRVCPTNYAENIASAIAPVMARVQGSMAGGLTAEEQRHLTELLRKLSEHLETMLAQAGPAAGSSPRALVDTAGSREGRGK